MCLRQIAAISQNRPIAGLFDSLLIAELRIL
jgi:hypothetical protein